MFQRVYLQKFAFEEVGLQQESDLCYLGGWSSPAHCGQVTIPVSTRTVHLLTTEPYRVSAAAAEQSLLSQVKDLAWVLSSSHCCIESLLMPGTRRQAWSIDFESATTILGEMILGLQDQWSGGCRPRVRQVNSVHTV